MPTVSVIIPTYNRANTIIRAINSVLNQTFQDFQIIIIDDASNDNTEEVIKNFWGKSSVETQRKIIYLKNELNRGANFSRNRGIKHAKTPFISFLDSDDEYTPYFLEKTVSILSSLPPQYSMVYCDRYEVIESADRNRNSKLEAQNAEPGIQSLQITQSNPNHKMQNSNKILYSIKEKQKEQKITFYSNLFYIGIHCLIKRDAILKIGLFNPHLRAYEDWEFFIRLSKFSKFYYLQEPLYIVHLSKENVHNLTNCLQAIYAIINIYRNDLRKNDNDYASLISLLSSYYKHTNRKNQAIRYLLSAFMKDKDKGHLLEALHISLGRDLYEKLKTHLKGKNRYDF